MPQPTAGDVHVNSLLTNVSVAFIQSLSNFVADQVFPNVPVTKQSDIYATYDRQYWMRVVAEERAPGTESAGGGWTVSNDNYFARIYAVHKDIDDPTRANADAPFRMDSDATEWVTRQLLLLKEQKWAAKFFLGTPWTTNLTGVAGAPGAGQFKQWDVAGSTPVQDILNYQTIVAELTGYKPNTLVIDPYTKNELKNHADILDRVKYTQRGQISDDLLASLFEVDRLLVPMSVKTTSKEGQAATYAFTFGRGALLLYSAPNPGLLTPSAGYTYSWTGFLGASQNGTRIKKFRMEPIESDRVEGEMAFDQKVVAPELGVWFGAPTT